MRNLTLQMPERDATRRFGIALGKLLRSGDVVALVGDLGAGKTTLTRGIGAGAGLFDDVTSPTFTLIHEYRGRIPIFHLDPYRLDPTEDLMALGLQEYLDRDGVLVVEWADRIAHLLPAERLTMWIDIVDGAAQAMKGEDLLIPNDGCPLPEEQSGAATEYDLASDDGEDCERHITIQAVGSRNEGLLDALVQDPDVMPLILREPDC